MGAIASLRQLGAAAAARDSSCLRRLGPARFPLGTRVHCDLVLVPTRETDIASPPTPFFQPPPILSVGSCTAGRNRGRNRVVVALHLSRALTARQGTTRARAHTPSNAILGGFHTTGWHARDGKSAELAEWRAHRSGFAMSKWHDN